MHLSISVDNTNKLRKQLGLRLIPTEAELPDPQLAQPPSSKERATHNINAKLDAAAERVATRAARGNLPLGDGFVEAKPMSIDEFLPKIQALNKPPKENGLNAEPLNAEPLDEKPHNENTVSEKPLSEKPSSDKRPSERLRSATPPLATEFELPNESRSEQRTLAKPKARAVLSELSELPTAPSGSVEDHLAKDYEDPLAAPSELPHSVEVKPKPQKAIFKPKRPKTTASTRARHLERSSLVTEIEEEDNFRSIIKRSRLQHANLGSDHTSTSQIFRREPHNGEKPVVISTVSSLVHKLESENLREEGRDVGSDTKKRGISDRSPQDDDVDQRSVDESSDTEDEASTTHMGGVADVLKQIGSAASSSHSKVSSTSKNWARDLAHKQKLRAAEVESAKRLYRALPPKERQEALGLHKRKLIQEQAAETKDVLKFYKPDVVVEHRDEHGHTLTAKQAFKQLSKSYHSTKRKRDTS